MGFTETFKALADPARREILLLLKGGRLTAGEIGSHFQLSGGSVSYHLAQLKKAGLVYESKYKNYVFYSLNTSVLEDVMLWASQFGLAGKEAAWDGKEDTQAP